MIHIDTIWLATEPLPERILSKVEKSDKAFNRAEYLQIYVLRVTKTFDTIR